MATADVFLEAEEAVRTVLGRLNQLKTEIEGYAESKTALHDVRNQLGELIRNLVPFPV